MSELLLEFLAEEMPATMLHNFSDLMLRALKSKIGGQLDGTALYTPRRICIHIKNINNRLQSETIKGPRVNAPSKAIEGFMRKYSISNINDLIIDGEFYTCNPSNNLSFPERIKIAIESSIKECTWPKSMRWSTHDINWVRPLHSIVCMFDNDELKIRFGHLTSSNKTIGHRFLSNQSITIDSANIDNYKQKLLDNKVIASIDDRKSIILNAIDEALAPLNLSLISDNTLLDEIANLIEYPVIFVAKIDQKFMKLPKEVLITTLKINQKYLLTQDIDNNLAPYFIIVSNNLPDDAGVEIISGNQRVLHARLYDALFFYEKDSEISLNNRIINLKSITFHKDIGTIFDKIQSVKKLANMIGKHFEMSLSDVTHTVELMKADLTTLMVNEFPELQGIMGSYYARQLNLSEEICTAIHEHYKPIGPNDTIPSSKLGLIVALSDKLDTLSQMFAINIKPTGSKDPYALRRAANGVNRILKELNTNTSILKQFYIQQIVINFINERVVDNI